LEGLRCQKKMQEARLRFVESVSSTDALDPVTSPLSFEMYAHTGADEHFSPLTCDPYRDEQDVYRGVAMNMPFDPETTSTSDLEGKFRIHDGGTACPEPSQSPGTLESHQFPENFDSWSGEGHPDGISGVAFKDTAILPNTSWDSFDVTPFYAIECQALQPIRLVPNFLHDNGVAYLEPSHLHWVPDSPHSSKMSSGAEPCRKKQPCGAAGVTFADTDVPPDGFLEPLEVTTFYVISCDAPKLGNHFLNFLRMNDNCHIAKVNTTKFTIKATWTRVDQCTFKARFYSQCNDQREKRYAVEFQRRCGDSIEFMTLYREAAKYLKEQCSLTLEGAPQSPQFVTSHRDWHNNHMPEDTYMQGQLSEGFFPCARNMGHTCKTEAHGFFQLQHDDSWALPSYSQAV